MTEVTLREADRLKLAATLKAEKTDVRTVTVPEAMQMLAMTPGHEGKQFKRVIAVVRDPLHSDQIIGIHLSERA